MNEKFAARATKFNDDGIPEAVYKMNSGLVKVAAGYVLHCFFLGGGKEYSNDLGMIVRTC